MKTRIHHFLNLSKYGSFFLATLILLSILIFTLETEYKSNVMLMNISSLIALIFGIEYFLRIWTANVGRTDATKARLSYIKSFSGIVDLVAFLPALLFPAASGSVILRLLRILRLVQLLKIKALTEGLNRTYRAIKSSGFELIVSFSVSLILIFLGAVLMYIIEGDIQEEIFGSIPRSLWWSVATLTTVGYGDVYPITAIGKFIASLMAIVGIGAVALPAGILAAAFSNAKKDKEEK